VDSLREPRKAVEKALLHGEWDGFEFFLGEKLGKNLGEIGALPNTEIVEWRAWFVHKQLMEDIEADKAEAKRGK
jgi:hypothetical protein